MTEPAPPRHIPHDELEPIHGRVHEQAMTPWGFMGELLYWHGPSPYHFIKVPPDACAELHALSPMVSYGWGVIPVTVRVGGSEWATSLFPKDGGYLVPIKDAIRRAEGLILGDTVMVELSIRE